MLQNAANDSATPEQDEKWKVSHASPNIHGLLKEAIEQEFGDPVDPEKFDSYKKDRDAINEKITHGMFDLRRQYMEDWGDVTDELIQQYTTNAILNEKVTQMWKNLVIRRKRAFDRVSEVFPQIADERADWEDMVRVWLSEMNERELEALIQKTHLVRKFVHRIFPSLQNITPSEKRNFERIFHDWKDRFQNPDDRARVKKIFHNYASYGQVPDADDINFLFSAYQNISLDRKKEILSAMGVVLSFRDAYDLELIDDAFLVEFAEEQFGSSYEQMSEFEKKTLIRSLSKNESHAISAKDFSEQGMDRVFSGEGVKRKLLKELVRSIALDSPEVPRSDDIVSQIRERKQREALARDKNSPAYGIEDDYDLHDEFINEMVQRLQKSDGTNHVKNLKLLREVGSVIRFDGADGNPQYIRLEKVQDVSGGPLEVDTSYGVQLEWLSVTNGYIRDHQHFPVTYQKFYEFLKDNQNVNVLSSNEFENLLTLDEANAGKDGKIFDARNVDQDPVTAENILTKINLLDPSGVPFGFETGTYFSAPSEEKQSGIKSSSDVWKVHKIHGDTLDIQSSTGNIETNISLQDFFNVIASSGTFRRTNKITDDASMIEALTEFRVAPGAMIKDGKLTMTEKDHDGHDHDTHISCFVGENKEEHIHIEFFRDGLVRFGEYKSPDELQKVKEHVKEKGIKNGIYAWKTMSYGAFIEYLQNQKKLKATTEHVLIPDAHHDLHRDHHHEHAHTEKSFLKRIMKWQNPASIWKGFEMIFHSIEHTLEKGAKLDAARFAMGTSRFLWLPDSVNAQVYSDITSASKEIIEKYENKIFGLPGPAGREKCIHIVHNEDSRPEEVMSAINYMLKSYGHLYSEDIRKYQPIVNQHNIDTADKGYFAFFDGFVLSSKLPGSLISWRQKAYKKAVTEMGDGEVHENEPTEEQLLHALFKSIDGNWDQYPYAASVVKASGWPGGLEKNWKFEWYKSAYEKGKDQSKMVNAQGRLNKWVWYFNTHEIYKVVGAMESVTAKTKDPGFQAIPFIWAVGGYSRFASHTALQELKKYAEMGYSFHAYSFLRNEQNNTIYRNTVRLALEDLKWKWKIPDRAIAEFDSICKRLESVEDPKVTESKYNKKAPATALMEFWQKYQGAGLHDMLQWHNGWLIKQAKEGNKTVLDYTEVLNGGHAMQLNDGKIPGNDFGKDWYDEHGLHTSRIWEQNSKTGLRSMNRILTMINLGRRTGDFEMQKEIHDKLWMGIVEQVQASRDVSYFDGDVELQKAQFLAYRDEIIDHFIKQLNPSWSGSAKADIDKPYQYWEELRNIGIDPRSIFDPEFRQRSVDSDYSHWVWNAWGYRANSTPVEQLQKYFQKEAHVKTHSPAANNPTYIDPDLHYPGWSADASDQPDCYKEAA